MKKTFDTCLKGILFSLFISIKFLCYTNGTNSVIINSQKKNALNYVELCNNKSFASQVTQSNVTYIIRSDFDPNGGQIKLPKSSTFKFIGGTINNGTLIGNSSNIISDNVMIFRDVVIKGTWKVADIYDTWFFYKTSKDNPANQIIKNIISLTDDTLHNTIHFISDRVYWYEVAYKGNPALGDIVRPMYAKLNSEEYAFLTIFELKSNTKMILNNVWKMIPTNQGAYFVFKIIHKENIEICGTGAIYGDAKAHLYSDPFVSKSTYYGEFGHIFKILSCNNVILRDITVGEAFGDGIGIGSNVVEISAGEITSSPSGGIVDKPTKNVLIDNVKVLFNRRNGISCAAHDVSIKNVYFEGNGIEEINGTAPMCGIDFESDYIKINPICRNENVSMSNCIFRNNRYDVSSTNNTQKDYGRYATVISDCNFTAPLRLNTTFWLKFINCHIPCISNVGNSINYYTESSHICYDNCRFDELNPYLTSAAAIYEHEFINCISPQDTEGMVKLFVNLNKGQVCKMSIPKGNFSQIELVAFANSGGIKQSTNVTTYTLGNSANSMINDFRIGYRRDSTLTTSIYKFLPIFSNVKYNNEENSYEIFLAMGNTIVGEDLDDTWRIVIYYNLKSEYSVIKHGNVAVGSKKGSIAISGGVYPTPLEVKLSKVNFEDVEKIITFPYAEMFKVIKGTELPFLDASDAGKTFFLLDDKIPVWYDSYTKTFRMSDGYIYKRKQGTTSERPRDVEAGFQYFDTTLKQPIWSAGNNQWVDALGDNI